jgi:hypothetical protein
MKMRRVSTKEHIVPIWQQATPETVQTAWEAAVKTWEDSEDCKQLRSLFQVVPLPRVNKIVAFACSGFGDGSNRPCALYQHALILTLRDILENRPDGEKVKCFVQDPIYTETDEHVLGNARITVLGDPRGFVEVDDQTLVISFAPNIPVRQIIADIARPPVMVWNRVMSEAEAAAITNNR